MTNRERSAVLRMAGNIASGAIAAAENAYSEKLLTLDQKTRIADESVSIALLILADPRIVVDEAE